MQHFGAMLDTQEVTGPSPVPPTGTPVPYLVSEVRVAGLVSLFTGENTAFRAVSKYDSLLAK